MSLFVPGVRLSLRAVEGFDHLAPEGGTLATLAPQTFDAHRFAGSIGPYLINRAGLSPETGSHAHGYHSDVFFAEDSRTGQPVVLKAQRNPWDLPHSALREEAVQEAQALADLGTSSRLPSFYGLGELNQGFVLVMEPARGQPMRRITKPLPPRVAIEEAIAVLKTLESVHKRNYLHADVHSGNLTLRREDGQAHSELLDAGTAVQMDASGQYRGQRHGGDWVAQAPEQFPDSANEITLTPASDLYFVGALLARMLTGRSPFKPDVPREPWEAFVDASLRMRQQPDPIPEVPEGPLKQVVLKALAWDPAQRFGSAREMRFALEGVRPNLE